MATILVEILGSAKQFKAELAGAEAATAKAGGSFAKMGAVAATAGVAIGAAVIYGAAKSVEAASSFQSSMELIQTQAGGSAKEVAKMSKALVNMATSVGQTPENLSKGLYHVESAGFRGAKALSILRLAAEGAAVGHADLEQVTTALVAAQKSGIAGLGNMSHAMGSLNAIVGAGNMRMDDLTSALGTGLLPVAKVFGLTIQDVGGALATMTRNGIPAVNAASGLKMMFASLAAPTHAAKKALESVGLSSTALADTMRHKGLAPALLELQQHMKDTGLNATQSAALLTTAFGKKSSTGLLTLLGNLKDVKSATEQVKTGAGDFGSKWAETQQTAEFASAKFHAALSSLEVQIGTALLPTVTRFTLWLTAEFPPAIAEAKKIIKELTPAFQAVMQAVGQVVSFIRAHWSQISAIIKVEIDFIVLLFKTFGDLIHGRWGAIWDDIKAILENRLQKLELIVKDFGPTILAALQSLGELAIRGLKAGLAALPGALEAGLKALPGLALKGAELVGRAIVAGVKWAVPHIAGLAGDLTGMIKSAISQVASWALGEAEKIGKSIATGILSGIEGLGSSLAGKLTGAVGGALGSVKSAFGISSPSKVFADQVGKPMGDGVIEGWLESTASLPTKMSQSLQNAITAGRAVIQAAQASFQTAWQQIASDADKAFAGIHGAKQTSAEKALASAQSAHDKAGRNQALTAAQGALDTANASGDPAAILAAQQQLEDAKYQIHIAALQKTAAAQRLQLDARNTLEQRHFDAALTNLQEHLAKGHTSYKDAHAEILKLFKTFGVNYSNAGAELGAAFVTGLKESIQGAAKGSGSLSGKLTDVADSIHIPHAATGGFVAQTGLAVIHKGETITPAGKGGGVTVVVNGWVGNDQDIAEKIRNVLIRTGRNTTHGALGGFA